VSLGDARGVLLEVKYVRPGLGMIIMKSLTTHEYGLVNMEFLMCSSGTWYADMASEQSMGFLMIV
jgi:hypothetical protein